MRSRNYIILYFCITALFLNKAFSQTKPFPAMIDVGGSMMSSAYQGTVPLVGMSYDYDFFSLGNLSNDPKITFIDELWSVSLSGGGGILYVPSRLQSVTYYFIDLQPSIPVLRFTDCEPLKRINIYPIIANTYLAAKNDSVTYGYLSVGFGGDVVFEIIKGFNVSIGFGYENYFGQDRGIVNTQGKHENFCVNLIFSFSPWPVKHSNKQASSQPIVPPIYKQLEVVKPKGFNIEGDDWSKESWTKKLDMFQQSPEKMTFKALPKIPILFYDLTKDPIEYKTVHDSLQAIIDNVKKQKDVNNGLVYISNTSDRKSVTFEKINESYWSDVAKIGVGDYSDFLNEFDKLFNEIQSNMGKEIKRADYVIKIFISKSTFEWLKSPDDSFAVRLLKHGISSNQVIFYVRQSDLDRERPTLAGCQLVVWK